MTTFGKKSALSGEREQTTPSITLSHFTTTTSVQPDCVHDMCVTDT